MKHVLMLIVIFASVTSQAANYGKFKLTADTGYYDAEEVIFLLNSSGSVKMLKNNDYYSIDSQFFFGENTMVITSGGDDDIIEGIISLKDNKATDGCAIMLAQSNEVGETMGPHSFKLERWNKYSKKYESVYPEGFEFSESCEKKILADYPDFDIF